MVLVLLILIPPPSLITSKDDEVLKHCLEHREGAVSDRAEVNQPERTKADLSVANPWMLSWRSLQVTDARRRGHYPL